MGKKKGTKQWKGSLASLPKGIVRGKGSTLSEPGNPFEISARTKRPKHQVHNRPLSKPKSTKDTWQTLKRRQNQLRNTLNSAKKSNMLLDRRIGEYDPSMSSSDQMLARLVKERTRQSQRTSRFRLDDDSEITLTHKGRKLDPKKTEALYSDDEDDYGNLEAIDTELHFGGAGIRTSVGPYGGSSQGELADVYGQRKTELDDLIARRKTLKAEKMQAKEAQVETVEKLDEGFSELSSLLLFRKDQPFHSLGENVTEEEKEMNEWNMQMKQMMLKPKRPATDRTKTAEEIAQEEAERLHKLEARRLARMDGDFEEDELSDISLVDDGKAKTLFMRNSRAQNPDELCEPEEAGVQNDTVEPLFTADGLKYLNKNGEVLGPNHEKNDESRAVSHDITEDLQNDPLPVGCKVQGNYRAAEQFNGQEAWYDGEVTRVFFLHDGSVRYDVEYLDGDFEEGMLPGNVRPTEDPSSTSKEDAFQEESREIQIKRNKARDIARKEIPFVFEVPTTLEAFHVIVSKYASTGKDVSTIIQRIHLANSVRLDHRNAEKMQNFYDVLLRRFIAVGDAIYELGSGGEELTRADQLNSLTKVLFAMAQESSEAAAAVWSRRVGILQSAHSKRLRDLEIQHKEDGENPSSWLSAGTFLLLKAASAVFPVTDKRHHVATPVNLLLGQMISQTRLSCTYDIVMGTLCSGLLFENGIVAKRVAPEAIAFLSGVLRLFSPDPGQFPLLTLESAYNLPDMRNMRICLKDGGKMKDDDFILRLQREFISKSDHSVAMCILNACLQLIEKFAFAVAGSFDLASEAELIGEVRNSLATLRPELLPAAMRGTISRTTALLSRLCPTSRIPLRRRIRGEEAGGIKMLAPRMEDPERYTISKDRGKKAVQVAIDRTHREYKREHKSISRELRIDASFIENERRIEQSKRDSKARAKRQKNFAWLEGEAATLNQQVAQGGGLLKGGGIGAAKAKAASAKLGIKKGGRF